MILKNALKTPVQLYRAEESIVFMKTKVETYYYTEVLNFLQWTNKIIHKSDTSIQSSAKCAIAIFLATTFISLFSFNISFETCESCLNIALALDSNLKYALSHIPGFVDTSTAHLPLHRKLRRYYSRAVDADFDFGMNTNLYRYNNLALTVAREFLNLKVLENIDFMHLINGIEKYKEKIPDDHSSFEECEYFARSICSEWLNYLQLPKDLIDLSPELGNILSNYLYMIELMIVCKEESSQISSKFWKPIEESLLQPKKNNDYYSTNIYTFNQDCEFEPAESITFAFFDFGDWQ